MTSSGRARAYHTDTICVQTGSRKDTTFNAVAVPIYATSTFAFEAPGQTKGFDYSRTANPTRSALEECLAALEGGAGASATATGMAAETTVMALFPAGSHVIAGHDIYGGSYRLFANVLSARGLEFSFVDMGSPRNVEEAIRPNTRAIWIETPSNPLLNLVDIAAICAIASRHGQVTIVDNTFMSPIFQKPLAMGADIVVHSTTKYLNGHSDMVGGAIISRTREQASAVAALVNALGTCSSPFDCWLVLRGIRTLPVRMQAHARNAHALAEFLARHPAVERVYYPGLASHPQHGLAQSQMSGFGGMLSFDIRGGKDAAFRFIQALELFAFAESLGGVESLVEHPETMSHASMTAEARRAAGITAANIRLSTGIENANDLVADVADGLAAASGA
ncbi:MAG: PLP-dependent aspartate aminotransferase family protein [Polyangia bacterium]